jgi:hypothetical protein
MRLALYKYLYPEIEKSWTQELELDEMKNRQS